jgi:hypothetical protein
MRATDFLTESQTTEIQTLTEGPLGSLIKAAGRGIGKAVGGVAKGAGAVAGGVAGIGSAFKKGYQSGKTTVAGDDATAQPQQTTTTGQTTTPAQTTTPTQGTKDTETTPATAPKTTATPKPTVQPAADPNATPKPTATTQPTTTDAKPMAGSGSETKPAVDAAKDTEYGKALKFVKGLPVAQQKEMVALLQKDPKVVAAMKRPAAKKDTAAPSSVTPAPVADTGTKEPTPGLTPDKFGQMAQNLAGGAQKAADAKPKETPKTTKKAATPAEPDLTDPNVPISQAIKRRQAQGLAAGYKNTGTMIGEGFSLFRKQQ